MNEVNLHIPKMAQCKPILFAGQSYYTSNVLIDQKINYYSTCRDLINKPRPNSTNQGTRGEPFILF